MTTTTTTTEQISELLDEALVLLDEHTLEAESADAELEDVLRFLRREETGHLQCDRPSHAAYVQELIGRFEQWEHRR